MQAVIFDVGRVLVHWDPDATLAGLAEISQATPAELRALWGQSSHDLGIGALPARKFHRYLIDHAGTDGNWNRFYTAFCRGLCRDDAALRYTAELAERGIPLGIISNTNAIHIHWLHTHLPELAHFRSVVWSSDVGLLKPDRAIYDLAVRSLGADPACTLFVDDLEENATGAEAAGLSSWVHRTWDETISAIEGWLRR
jgi:HAD superfamily hydrolase (TIGR01549 family)